MFGYFGEDSATAYVVGSWEAVKHAQTAESFLDPEKGLPAIQAHFDSYHTFQWIAGLLGILQRTISSKSCCTEWARELHLPAPDILVDLMQDAQAAYVQGMVASIGGATYDEMQYWYADVITNREKGKADVVEALQEGQIPVTNLEMEAAGVANNWKNMISAGGAQRAQALAEAGIDPATGKVADNWAGDIAPVDINNPRALSGSRRFQTAPAGRGASSALLQAPLRPTLPVRFSGYGDPEVSADEQGKVLPVTGKDVAAVAVGTVAMYFLVEAYNRHWGRK
jgi:hypothetical protein